MSPDDSRFAAAATATLDSPQPMLAVAGARAQERQLGARGQETLRKLVTAGMVEFSLHGYRRVRIDDVVRRARLSRGTFYSYYSDKTELFLAVQQHTIQHMQLVMAGFPAVTRDAAGRQVLRRWVGEYGDAYAMHAMVIGDHSWTLMAGPQSRPASNVRRLLDFAHCISKGMAAAAAGSVTDRQRELSALACLMMLERANQLFSVNALPRADLEERMTDVMLAAFSA